MRRALTGSGRISRENGARLNGRLLGGKRVFVVIWL